MGLGPMQVPRWIQGPFPTPAAGADFTIKPVGQGGILVKTVRFTFTADAVVGNRSIRLLATDGTTVWWETDLPALVAALGVVPVSLFDGATPGVAASGLVTLALPLGGLWLPQGHSLVSLTAGIDPGDTYSGLAGLVYELPSGPYVRMDPTSLVYLEAQE